MGGGAERLRRLLGEELWRGGLGLGRDVMMPGGGWHGRSPQGAWRAIRDRRTGGVFYYNPVLRVSTWERPKDMPPLSVKKDLPEAAFGLSIYLLRDPDASAPDAAFADDSGGSDEGRG